MAANPSTHPPPLQPPGFGFGTSILGACALIVRVTTVLPPKFPDFHICMKVCMQIMMLMMMVVLTMNSSTSQTIPHQLSSIHILVMDNASSSGMQSLNTHPAAWPESRAFIKPAAPIRIEPTAALPANMMGRTSGDLVGQNRPDEIGVRSHMEVTNPMKPNYSGGHACDYVSRVLYIRWIATIVSAC